MGIRNIQDIGIAWRGSCCLTVVLLTVLALGGCVTPVSVSSDGEFGNGGSYNPAVSADGRFVAFESEATNLDRNFSVPSAVPRDGASGPPTANRQIYVRDLQRETTEIVSLTASGQLLNGVATEPAISRDGCVVTFQTNADNVVPGLSTTDITQVYARDRCVGTTTLLSKRDNGYRFSRGGQDASPILDGRGVYFVSSSFGGPARIFLHHFSRGNTAEFSAGFAPVPGLQPVTNNDGGWVCFISRQGLAHVDRNDRNVAAGLNLQWPSVYVWATRKLIRVSPDVGGASRNPSMAPAAAWIAFESDGPALFLGNPGDTNNAPDIYVFNPWAYLDPVQYRNPQQWLIRASISNNFDLANGPSRNPSMSDVGKVAFESDATNLVPDDANGRTDTFLRDITTNETELISRSFLIPSWGAPGNSHSSNPSISANGKVIAFLSMATNFVVAERRPTTRTQIYVYEEFEIAWTWRWVRPYFTK